MKDDIKMSVLNLSHQIEMLRNMSLNCSVKKCVIYEDIWDMALEYLSKNCIKSPLLKEQAKLSCLNTGTNSLTSRQRSI